MSSPPSSPGGESETDPINQTDPPFPEDSVPESEPEPPQEPELETQPEPEEPTLKTEDSEIVLEEVLEAPEAPESPEKAPEALETPESQSPKPETPEEPQEPKQLEVSEPEPEVVPEEKEVPEPVLEAENVTPEVTASPEHPSTPIPTTPQEPLTNSPEAMEEVPTVQLENLSVQQSSAMQNNENGALKNPETSGQGARPTPAKSGIRKPQAVLRQPVAVVRPSTTPVPQTTPRAAPSPRPTSISRRMSRERSDVQKPTSTRSIDNVGKFTPKVNAKFVNVKSKVGSTSNHKPGGGNVEIFSEKKQYNVQSRVGSLQNAGHVAGGGNVQIESRKLDFSHASPKVGSKTGYVPAESSVKIMSEKLTWNAKSKVGSMENATHKPTGGNVQIHTQKLNWKAESKVGSKDNIKHRPGGGNVKKMQAKLFMIPWIIKLVVGQRVPLQAPSAETLTNDLLVDAHQRHFYEMLRRQQQINDALLRNNALLHIPRIPVAPVAVAPTPHLLPPAPFFNPFIQQPIENQEAGSTSKLGTYEEVKKTEEKQEKPEETEETEGTVEAPSRTEPISTATTKKSLAGVKTVSIQRKGDASDDSEVVRLLKKLSLSKEEQNGIVKHMEQLVREELLRKLSEVEAKKEEKSTTTSTTTTTEAPTTTSTVPPTTTITMELEPESEPEMNEEEEEVIMEEEPTTTVAVPKLQIRSEEKNVTLVRNNLKLHPIKLPIPTLQPEKETLEESRLEEEEVSQGSIKTSLTHLPIIVANEEEDVTQKAATLHKRISQTAPVAPVSTVEREPSRDVLVDFATGAPLDLTEGTLVTRQRVVEPLAVVTTSKPATAAPIRSVVGLPRQTHHEVTNFERLATDYRARLENTGDIHKILQKISENAYISLERGGPQRKLFGA